MPPSGGQTGIVGATVKNFAPEIYRPLSFGQLVPPLMESLFTVKNISTHFNGQFPAQPKEEDVKPSSILL